MAGKTVKPNAGTVDRTTMNDRDSRIAAMLTALEDEAGLTQWEKEFVMSITSWFLIEEKYVTDKQYERLEIIYRKFN